MSFLIVEVNAKTGETIERQATQEEIEQRAKIDAELIQEAELKVAKETKRVATLAKLEALGLDEDDLKALGL